MIQYEKLMEDINNLCNNVLIEENKNTLKIIYINKVNKLKINEIFDESKYWIKKRLNFSISIVYASIVFLLYPRSFLMNEINPLKVEFLFFFIKCF